MPVLVYRGSGAGARHTFNSPTFLHVYENKTNWILIILLSLIFIIVFLFMSPKSVQPRATHFGYIFALVFAIICLKLLYNYMTKNNGTNGSLIELNGQTHRNDSRYNSRHNSSVYNIDMSDSMPQTRTGSQISLNPSEFSMPPKYELPPSYSQAVSQLTINRC
ncbi:unnamed protein product [Medioppia subpectinata]|uniref:Uncharacterized protein n=1 Tax=Medioppia subpectinata TaxID=1979941 RepID=A0A7R9KDY7_9ACAR|nr:unnamed protein product [Medioppia subpectinata]CAG2101574.1 unnamed protein product [Medioppia subpectinata]